MQPRGVGPPVWCLSCRGCRVGEDDWALDHLDRSAHPGVGRNLRNVQVSVCASRGTRHAKPKLHSGTKKRPKVQGEIRTPTFVSYFLAARSSPNNGKLTQEAPLHTEQTKHSHAGLRSRCHGSFCCENLSSTEPRCRRGLFPVISGRDQIRCVDVKSLRLHRAMNSRLVQCGTGCAHPQHTPVPQHGLCIKALSFVHWSCEMPRTGGFPMVRRVQVKKVPVRHQQPRMK